MDVHEGVRARPTEISILIVEDEILVARDIESKLKKMGHSVCGIASSGREAINMCGEFMPSLIMMDITIEGDMDGIQTAEVIEEKYNLPVVFLTAHSDLGTLHRAKLTMPFGYIIKPFSQRDLVINIGMALYRHKMMMKVTIVNSILRVFLKPMDFGQKLQKSLELLVSIPRLFLQTKGVVYLADKQNPGVFKAIASLGGTECDTVKSGICLCGMAASTGNIIFADKINKEHELNQDALAHGHYCVPIKVDGGVAGIINVYVPEGHKRDESDEKLLLTYAGIIAETMINAKA
jgi:CheY-like chemotaxis protein